MNATATPTRLQKVLSGLQSRGIYFDTATEYGEPGYSTDKPLILFANWNDLNRSEMNAVESVAEVEWSDEWTTDSDGRAFRTQPDCHWWEPAFFVHDGEVVPWDSLSEDGEALEDELRDFGFTAEKGDAFFRALPSVITPARLATIATLATPDDMETGFHHGQNDSPEKLLRTLPDGTYLFRITGKGQFDVHWQAWRLISSDD